MSRRTPGRGIRRVIVPEGAVNLNETFIIEIPAELGDEEDLVVAPQPENRAHFISTDSVGSDDTPYRLRQGGRQPNNLVRYREGVNERHQPLSPPRHFRPGLNQPDSPFSPPRPFRPGLNQPDSPLAPPRHFRPGVNQPDSPLSPPRNFRPGLNQPDSPLSPPRNFRPGVNQPDSPVSPPRNFRPGLNQPDSPLSPPRNFRPGVNQSDSPLSPPDALNITFDLNEGANASTFIIEGGNNDTYTINRVNNDTYTINPGNNGTYTIDRVNNGTYTISDSSAYPDTTTSFDNSGPNDSSFYERTFEVTPPPPYSPPPAYCETHHPIVNIYLSPPPAYRTMDQTRSRRSRVTSAVPKVSGSKTCPCMYPQNGSPWQRGG